MEGSGPQPKDWSEGSVGSLNRSKIRFCFSKSHAWAMFGSIFPICFPFPQHRMWKARITQHSLLIPGMPLNSLPWIFCSHPCWIIWMAPSTHHAISYFWAFARAVFSAQIALPTPTFTQSPRHCTGLFLQDVHLPLGNLHDELFQRDLLCVSLSQESKVLRGRRALVWEDPTCHGATKPVHHNYWACALEPASHNYWSLCATTTEARAP